MGSVVEFNETGVVPGLCDDRGKKGRGLDGEDWMREARGGR
jgi:hypothetical protein